MEFRIDKEVLVRALQKVQGIVEKRNTMPILSNVLIEAAQETLFITATDLEVGMRSTYPADVINNGKITVSAKKLYEITRELPDEQVHFATKGNDWVEIRCGKANFTIVGLSPDEFPYFPKVEDATFLQLSSGLLSGMIEQTSYAICHDETKYNLNGIYIKTSIDAEVPKLIMVATDGHRLCVADRELTDTNSDVLSKGVIFPKKGVFELKKMTEEEDTDIMLGFMDNSAVLKKGNTTIVMRLVDGEFPDYTKVIPANNDKLLTVNREQFLHSLKRMAILSSEKFKGIKFDISGSRMEISSSNPELGEAREELEIDYASTDIVARFNARYMIDVLNILTGDDVVLQLRDEMSPAILKPAEGSGFLSVVMPMRL
jgi:DNA polymerase III subunit beta